jgi:hypothetical protein
MLAVASGETLQKQVVDIAGSEAVTYPHGIVSMTETCSCGCGCLTEVNLSAMIDAHLWPDQIRFTLKGIDTVGVFGFCVRAIFRILMFYACHKTFSGKLVMLKFADGARLQCEPIGLRAGRRDFCTERGCKWWMLGTSNGIDAEFQTPAGGNA